MMDFRKCLEVRHEENVGRFSYRIFHPVVCGNFKISIQASENHYCSPRSTIDVNDYERMEIAVFDDNNEWVNLFEDHRFDSFKRIEEIHNQYDGMVAGYIDVSLIQEFCDFVSKM